MGESRKVRKLNPDQGWGFGDGFNFEMKAENWSLNVFTF